MRTAKSSDPKKVQGLSFQNIKTAADRVQDLFDVDLRGAISAADWSALHRAFMKRHVVAHRSGVVDDRYLIETSDPDAVAGRRIPLTAAEVQQVIGRLRAFGQSMAMLLPSP